MSSCGGAWWAAVQRVAQNRTRLKRLSMHACIGEGNATHSSILAWRIPGMEEPGRLPSMGSHRVGHDWSNLAAAAAAPKSVDFDQRNLLHMVEELISYLIFTCFRLFFWEMRIITAKQLAELNDSFNKIL